MEQHSVYLTTLKGMITVGTRFKLLSNAQMSNFVYNIRCISVMS